jgi:hypothetical protein
MMCIRITRELKHVYEYEMRISLETKISFPIFVKILALLGYLNSTVGSKIIVPTMTRKEENLVSLAWQTIRCQGHPDIHKDNVQFSQKTQDIMPPDFFDYVSFENFAMLLNLINNVYIKSSVP